MPSPANMASYTGEVIIPRSIAIFLADNGWEVGPAIPTIDRQGNLRMGPVHGLAGGLGGSIILEEDATVDGVDVGADPFVPTGGIVLGHTEKISLSGLKPQLQILGRAGQADAQGVAAIGYWTNNNLGPILRFLKSRSDDIGQQGIVQDGDELGIITFHADDGTDYESRGAEIRAKVDGTPGANDTPGRLEFRTTPDGAHIPITRMEIDRDGKVGIGTSPSDSALLDLSSTTGALLIPRMTTTQRDALTAANGMDIYNTTDNEFQRYENGAWASPGTGDVTAAANMADNKLVRGDGGAKGVQDSNITISDTDTMTIPLGGELKIVDGDIALGGAIPSAGAGGVLVLKEKGTTDPTIASTQGAVYAKTVGGKAGTTEVFVQDGAGNVTQISPHCPKTGRWVYSSENKLSGEKFVVDLERLVAAVEKITGEQYRFDGVSELPS